MCLTPLRITAKATPAAQIQHVLPSSTFIPSIYLSICFHLNVKKAFAGLKDKRTSETKTLFWQKTSAWMVVINNMKSRWTQALKNSKNGIRIIFFFKIQPHWQTKKGCGSYSRTGNHKGISKLIHHICYATSVFLSPIKTHEFLEKQRVKLKIILFPWDTSLATQLHS